MMAAERPIPIGQLRDKFLERQSIVMRQLKRREHLLEPRLKPEHLLLLARIKRRFTRASLSQLSKLWSALRPGEECTGIAPS